MFEYSAGNTTGALNPLGTTEAVQHHNPALDRFSGLTLIHSMFLSTRKQVRFPRSKKRRIKKKWAKRKSNWIDEPDQNVYRTEDMIIGHPQTIARLTKQLKEV